MASAHPRLSDKTYLNWLKDTLSLNYLKEGIELILDNEAVRFHEDIQKTIGAHGAPPKKCLCNSDDLKKEFSQRMWTMSCPQCNIWLEQINEKHVNSPLSNLHPQNTDPQLWPTKPYEVFKCYMSYGCQSDQSAKDGDVQSILKLIKNCQHFSTCGRIGKLDLIDELLMIRNVLIHSGKLAVADTDLQSHKQTMLDFLRGMTSLSADESQSVKEAINKITELQTKLLDISLNRELELKALRENQIALHKDQIQVKDDIRRHETDVQCNKNELCSRKRKADVLEADLTSLQNEVQSVATKSTTTETDVNTLTEKTHQLESELKRIDGIQDTFTRFLQANGLEKDLTALSTTIGQQDQRIQHLEIHTKTHQSQLELQQSRLDTYHTDQQQHSSRIQSQEDKLTELEDRIHALKNAIEPKEKSEEDTKVHRSLRADDSYIPSEDLENDDDGDWDDNDNDISDGDNYNELDYLRDIQLNEDGYGAGDTDNEISDSDNVNELDFLQDTLQLNEDGNDSGDADNDGQSDFDVGMYDIDFNDAASEESDY